MGGGGRDRYTYSHCSRIAGVCSSVISNREIMQTLGLRYAEIYVLQAGIKTGTLIPTAGSHADSDYRKEA